METAPRKHLRWLHDELPWLLSGGVIDARSERSIREHYGLDPLAAPRNIALLIFSVLGAGLTGAGVILILAHNWTELSRPMRAGISLGMLLAAQGVAGFALLRKSRSPAWTEASALGLTLSIGASMALISQTYHVKGETGDFVLSWLVLAVPVFYILRARVSALACLALSPFLLDAAFGAWGASKLPYLATITATLPYIVFVSRRQASEFRTRALQWMAAITIPPGIIISIADLSFFTADEIVPLLIGTFYPALYVLRSKTEGEAPSFGSPLGTVGLVGTLGFALVMTVDAGWPSGAMSSVNVQIVLLLVAVVVTGVMLRRAVRQVVAQRQWECALVGGLPLVTLIGMYALAPFGRSLVAEVMMNVYLLALGLAFLWSGVTARALRRTNVGLLILGLLFSVRYLDQDLSLVARGIGMMIMGAFFIGINVWLSRRNNSNGPEDFGPGLENQGAAS